jgi:hypothetical protein
VACVCSLKDSVALHTEKVASKGPRGSLSVESERRMTPSCSQIELRKRAATMATAFRSLGSQGRWREGGCCE